MYAITAIVVALAGLATAAPAVPAKAHNSEASPSKLFHIDDYAKGLLPPLAPIKWIGELEKGGPTVNITGSHHEVTAKIKSLQPWWHREGTYNNATYESIMNGSLHGYEPHEEYATANSSITKRSNRFNQNCFNQLYPQANWGREATNVQYLTTHFGNGMCGVAANSCGRFSCSYDNSILFCNNEPNEIVIPCPLLAQNHNFVLQYCKPQPLEAFVGPDYIPPYTGQAYYHNPTYNVIQKGMFLLFSRSMIPKLT